MTASPHLLVATWGDGVFVFGGEARGHELAGRSVRALARDRGGSVLAVVDGRSVCRRSSHGTWSTIATSAVDVSCIVADREMVYLGTDDARVLRVADDGNLLALPGFDAAPGRDRWYAGTALVNGHLVGPPLGVRSLAVTVDGVALLANVHVGGIPRSTDGGQTWEATIEIDCDVHEVRTHPVRPNIVVAAAAVGLCISRDAGATWAVERHGLHAPYCSAVAFAGSDVLVAAATDHFASQGAVYRRPLEGTHALERIVGLPAWLGGIADTGCLAARGAAVAVADKAGNLYASADAGHSWHQPATGLPAVSTLLVL